MFDMLYQASQLTTKRLIFDTFNLLYANYGFQSLSHQSFRQERNDTR
jgi:hypothetical protein